MDRTAGVPHPVDVHVGARLRVVRKQRGVSQQQVANSVGMTFQQIQKYERGTNRISASVLYQIAQQFDTSIMTFFQGLPMKDVVVDDVGALASRVEGARDLLEGFAKLDKADQRLVVEMMERLEAGGRRSVKTVAAPEPANEPEPMRELASVVDAKTRRTQRR